MGGERSFALDMQQGLKQKKILVAKVGLDGHDRGALILCRAFRDAGAEVIYSGLFATPERVAIIARDEDVNVVALSSHSNAHLQLFPKVVQELRKKEMSDVLVIGGGIIPEEDKQKLEEAGVKGNFGSGTSLETIMKFIVSNIRG